MEKGKRSERTQALIAQMANEVIQQSVKKKTTVRYFAAERCGAQQGGNQGNQHQGKRRNAPVRILQAQ